MRKPCCDKKDLNKGAWTKQEDDKLIDYISKHGEGCWRKLPQAAGLFRCGKSCRLRWINYLRPDLKRGNFDEDEEELIIKLHALLGNRWSLIAGRLPGRTDNEVKNYWNSHLRRKLIKKGIDPNHHKLSCLNLTHNPEISSSISSKTPAAKYESAPKSNYMNINNDDDDDDKAASEDTSCLLDINENSSSCSLLPDLNLDLTITINHSSAASSQSTNHDEIVIKESQKQNQFLISKDLESNSSSNFLGLKDQTRLTIFAPLDRAMAKHIGNFTGYSTLVRRHIVPCKFEWTNLENLDDGSALRTTLDGFNLNITRSLESFNVNGVQVILPDLYRSDWLVVHGILEVLELPEPKPEDVVRGGYAFGGFGNNDEAESGLAHYHFSVFKHP